MKTESQSWIHLSIPWLMLFLPLLSVCTAPLAGKNFKYKVITIIFPAVALLLYPFYELGIPPGVLIRMDLLFIIPVLVFNLVLVIKYCFKETPYK